MIESPDIEDRTNAELLKQAGDEMEYTGRLLRELLRRDASDDYDLSLADSDDYAEATRVLEQHEPVEDVMYDV